jgi:short-subunit dehydrogenase
MKVLILGATSAIAQAYARRRAANGCDFMLVGRREDRLNAIAADLRACGAASVATQIVDLAAIERIEAQMRAIRARFDDPDEVVIAHGVLGQQADAERDLAQVRGLIDSNFTSAALWILALLRDRLSTDHALTIVGIGSVAGDRGRASNFIYGSAKAGFDRFLEGLAHKYDGSPVRIVRVKPGFVDTPMTAGIAKSGPLWAKPDRVAADIERAVEKGRRIVYTPWFWWPIIMIIRHLPWFVFRRLKI